MDSTPSLLVARLTPAGQLDPAFATGGKLITTSGAETTIGNLAVTADGHILVAATSTGAATSTPTGLLVKLTAGGVRDATFGTSGEVRLRLGGADTAFNDIGLDSAERIYLAGSRATTPRHQMVVARLTTAGTLDPAYNTSGYAAADLNGASAGTYEVAAQRLRVEPTASRLVASTVQSATGPVSHLIGLARLTPAGILETRFGTAGTRTQDVSPSHVTDTTSLVTLPSGFVVGGAMTVGSTTQWALAGYHEDGSPDNTLNPANTTAANAANLVVGTGGPDKLAALAVTPAGSPAGGGNQPDAERAEPQRDRPPRRRRPLPAGERQGHVGPGRARPRGPAWPNGWFRRIGVIGSRRSDRQVRVGHRRRRDVRAQRREGARQLPGADHRRRDPARDRRRRAHRGLRRDGDGCQ